MEVFPYRELILASSFNLHQVPACASTGSVCVVERSFAWAARFRRLARDYEHLSADQLAVGPVKGDGGLNVDIGEAVAVDHAEGVFAFQVLSDAAQSSPVSTRVNLSRRAVLPAGGLFAPEERLLVQIRQRTV
jgi:hypothetical protein